MCFMSGEVTEVVWAIPVCYVCSKKPSDTAFHRWSLMKDGTPVQNPALAMYSAHGQNRSGHLDLRHLSEYTMPYLLRVWCSVHASVTYPQCTLSVFIPLLQRLQKEWPLEHILRAMLAFVVFSHQPLMLFVPFSVVNNHGSCLPALRSRHRP